MGERKVLNKYYPPDFDPSKIPRRRQPKNLQIKVRMMLPMSIRCNTCGNYIYKGTKFNSRKEDCLGETYLGIQILRFYFKCSRCSAELTMKTDPQNSDYTMESGATRNFEPWRAADEALEGAKSKRDAEEMGDAMKALENRTLDSKHEMDIMAALDEMKSMRARHASVGTTQMLEALNRTKQAKERSLEQDDEALLRSIVFQNSGNFVRRLDDDEFEDDIEEFDFEEHENKRRKMDSQDGGSVDEKNKPPQATVDPVVEHIPERSDKGQPPKGKTSGQSVPFIVRPKPVAFSIKPKVSNGSAAAKETTSVTSQLKDGERAQEENASGKTHSVSMGLAALCSTYDSSESDSEDCQQLE